LQDAFPAILARRREPVAVLATGDPFFHGVGSLLAEKIDPSEITVFPAPSAYTLAAAKLGWAGQDCQRISLHGRALERIIPLLHPGAKILALSWDESTPRKLARLLSEKGFGLSKLTVLEALGGPREKIRAARAEGFAIDGIDPLNTIGLEVIAEAYARAIPVGPCAGNCSGMLARAQGRLESSGCCLIQAARQLRLKHAPIAPRGFNAMPWRSACQISKSSKVKPLGLSPVCQPPTRFLLAAARPIRVWSKKSSAR
jgi:precorrin-6y C5,15-methyltransferase (decarboxylating) CbiE subunit